MVKAAYVDKNGLKRGAWSEEEDIKLRTYILRYKAWNWRQLPKFAGLARCGKSCRLRWENYLKPGLKRGNFTKEDEELILRLHQQHGNRWSFIAKSMPGRTDNEIKNYWHTILSKRTKHTKFTESLNQLQSLDQNKEASAGTAGSYLSTRKREEDANFFDCLSPISSPRIIEGLDTVPGSYGNFGNFWNLYNEPPLKDSSNSSREYFRALDTETFPSSSTMEPLLENDHSLSDPSKWKKPASTSCISAMATQEYGTPDGNSCVTSETMFTDSFPLDASNSQIWPSTMFDPSSLSGDLDSMESFGFLEDLRDLLQ